MKSWRKIGYVLAAAAVILMTAPIAVRAEDQQQTSHDSWDNVRGYTGLNYQVGDNWTVTEELTLNRVTFFGKSVGVQDGGASPYLYIYDSAGNVTYTQALPTWSSMFGVSPGNSYVVTLITPQVLTPGNYSIMFQNTWGNGGSKEVYIAWQNSNVISGHQRVYRDWATQTLHDESGADAYFIYDYNIGAPAEPQVGTSFHYGATETTAAADGIVVWSGSSNVTMVALEWGAATGNYSGNWSAGVNIQAGDLTWYVFSGNLTGLTSGVAVYYRAKALNGSGWGYGSEMSFVHEPSPSVETTRVTQVAGYPASLVQTITSTGSANASAVFGIGFNVWTSENELVGTVSEYQGPYLTGEHALAFPYNLYTREYKFQAWATTIAGTGYGDIVSFNGSGTLQVPSVTTIPAEQYDEANVLLGGFIENPNGTVYEVGIQWRLSTDNSDAAQNILVQTGTFGRQSFSGMYDEFPADTTIVYRAYAVNDAGTGYGYAYEFTTSSEGLPGVTALSSVVSGTSVLLTGELTSLGSGAVRTLAFRYSTHSDMSVIAKTWTQPTSSGVSWPLGEYSHQFDGLTESTHYYWQAGAWNSRVWTWSNTLDFITGVGPPAAVFNAPVVTTNAATSITVSAFIANATITSVGSSNITERGFDISFLPNVWQQRLTEPVNSGSTGAYSMSISPFSEGQVVYFRAVVINADNLTGVGAQKSLTIGVTGGAPGTATPPAQNALRGMLARLGMDNTFGRWASMGILMFIVLLLTVVCVLFEKDRTVKKLISGGGLMVCVAVFGTYLFSGLLGIWPVALLVIFVAAIIAIFSGKVANEGRVNG